MLFDRSRVFTSLNADELRAGDKVIVANTMAELKRIITGEIYCIAHIMRVNDEDCENRFCIGESNATGDITYPLAYLVERKENCTNCGKHEDCGFVQNQSRFANLNRCEAWKPKTEQKAEKHYRPFKDTDELIKVWDAKCPNKRPVGMTMPLIWVRNKSDRRVWLINEFDNRILDYLFPNCEFLDGSPCGVKN